MYFSYVVSEMQEISSRYQTFDITNFTNLYILIKILFSFFFLFIVGLDSDKLKSR